VTGQPPISRRRVLTVVGTGTAAALAGCTGNSSDGEGDQPPNEENQPESETQTEQSTDTKSQFSTEGNDSELISKSPEELLITGEDLPINGYSLSDTQSDENDPATTARKEFTLNDQTLLEVIVEVYEEISQAKTRYGQLTYSNHLGAGEPDRSQQLDIGVRSQFASGSFGGGSASIIRFRDANVFALLSWRSASESREPLELETLGEIAVTMHAKWR
jgi:hypothetical protein